jgi:hypothetical protein
LPMSLTGNDLEEAWQLRDGVELLACRLRLLPGSHKDHAPAILARGRECRRVGLGSGALPRVAQVDRTLPYREKSSRILPVPRTTEVSGSSSTRTGRPVSSIRS